MGFESILNQKEIRLQLMKILTSGKIPNAMCFYGAEGVGKFALALEFVKASSCLQPSRDENTIESCGECKNCKNIESGRYPNLEFVFSLPQGKGSEKGEPGTISSLSQDQILEINSKLIQKIQNPYSRFSIEGASQIRISAIREMRQNLALSNNLPGRKFIIIFNADEMRVEAQNAFLKTLEEPRNNVTFILLTTNKDKILPTILSRCVLFFAPNLEASAIEGYLIGKMGIEPSRAKLISKFSDGSMLKAMEFVESNIVELRSKMIDILRIALKKKLQGGRLVEAVGDLTQNFDKRISSTALELFARWFRDAILIQKNGNRENIVNIDDIEALERFASKFVIHRLNSFLEIIENCNREIYSNVPISQSFLNLFLKIRQEILS